MSFVLLGQWCIVNLSASHSPESGTIERQRRERPQARTGHLVGGKVLCQTLQHKRNNICPKKANVTVGLVFQLSKLRSHDITLRNILSVCKETDAETAKGRALIIMELQLYFSLVSVH